MKKTNRSGRLSILKALPVLALMVVLFMAYSCGNNADKSKSQTPSESQEYVNVDKMPQFPGGEAAMTKFIVDNVKYPDAAMKSGTQGKVFVKFKVTKTGKLDNIKVVQKVNELLDAEAIRVVSAMPDWVPGENKGAAVDVELTLPISFKLE